MALNPAIFNVLAQRPKSVADYDNEYAQQEANKLALQANQLGMQEKQRSLAEAQAFRNALTTYDPSNPQSMNALLRASPALAQKFQADQLGLEKTRADVNFKNAQADKERLAAGLQRFEIIGQLMGGVKDQASYDAARQAAAQEFGTEFASKIDPVYDPVKIAQNQAQAMSVKARLEQEWKAKGYDLDVRKQAETERNNQTQNALSRGQLGVAQANVGLRRQELEHNKSAPRGVIVQTDQGPVLVDPRNPNSAAPITGADGKPLGPKLKDVPAPMQKAMIENATNLQRAERALALLEGKNLGEMKGDKEATGWKGFLPNTLLNRVDPQGVDARAAIADLGSLVIHDRSGAAVTAAEFPRLAPFIPLATDDAETAKKKVKRFIQVYREEIDNTKSMYGPDAGFKPFGGAQPAAVTPAGGGVKFLGFE